MEALILAGGPAKQVRLVLGREGSRSLLRFMGRTLLERIVEAAGRVYDSVNVVSDDYSVARLCGGSGCRFVEQRGRGVEAAICSGLSALGRGDGDELVTLIYGDIYASEGFIESHALRVMNSYEPLITVTRPVVLRGGYLRVDVDTVESRVTRVGEGPFIYAGLATLPAGLLRERLCSGGGSFEEVVRLLASQGRLSAMAWVGEWLDIDTPWDYLVATRLELSKLRSTVISPGADVGKGVVIEGPVYIDEGARVDAYAVVKGPAYIGRGCLIGAHSFLRGGVAVYDGATVGAFSEVKRSLVYEKAFIGSHSYIADSVVGLGAMVSPYTMTLNVPYRSVSGEIVIMSTQPLESLKIGSVIAAGSRTRPRDIIPAASIYGIEEAGSG